jgi:hypothetical protein
LFPLAHTSKNCGNVPFHVSVSEQSKHPRTIKLVAGAPRPIGLAVRAAPSEEILMAYLVDGRVDCTTHGMRNEVTE